MNESTIIKTSKNGPYVVTVLMTIILKISENIEVKHV